MKVLFFCLAICFSSSLFGQLTEVWPTQDYFKEGTYILDSVYYDTQKNECYKENYLFMFCHPKSELKFMQYPAYYFKPNVEWNEKGIEQKLKLSDSTRLIVLTDNKTSYWIELCRKKTFWFVYVMMPWDELSPLAKSLLKNKYIFLLGYFEGVYFFYDDTVLKVYNQEKDIVMDASAFFEIKNEFIKKIQNHKEEPWITEPNK